MLYTVLFFIGIGIASFYYKYSKVFKILCNFTYQWLFKRLKQIEHSKFQNKYLEINFKEQQSIQKIFIAPHKISGIYKIEVLADGSQFPLWINHNKILKCTHYLGLPMTPLCLGFDRLEITLTSLPMIGNPICINFLGSQVIDLQKAIDGFNKTEQIKTSIDEEIYD
jgi:hypothetical protein